MSQLGQTRKDLIRADSFRLLLAIVDPPSSHQILARGLAFGLFPDESNSAINDKFEAVTKLDSSLASHLQQHLPTADPARLAAT